MLSFYIIIIGYRGETATTTTTVSPVIIKRNNITLITASILVFVHTRKYDDDAYCGAACVRTARGEGKKKTKSETGKT